MEKAASFLSSLLDGGGGAGEEPAGEPAATVASILIYPIKSCRGVSVPQAPVTSFGFRRRPSTRTSASGTRPSTPSTSPPRPPRSSHPSSAARSCSRARPPSQTSGDSSLVARSMSWSSSTPSSGSRSGHSRLLGPGPGSAARSASPPLELQRRPRSNPSNAKSGSDSVIPPFETEVRPTNPDYIQGYKITFTDCFPFLVASQEEHTSPATRTPHGGGARRRCPREGGARRHPASWRTCCCCCAREGPTVAALVEDLQPHLRPQHPKQRSSSYVWNSTTQAVRVLKEMARRCYVVYIGRVPGVYEEWKDCQRGGGREVEEAWKEEVEELPRDHHLVALHGRLCVLLHLGRATSLEL